MLDSTGKYKVDDRGFYELGVVHSSLFKAERAIKELGLEGAYPMSMGIALAGSRYNKIIILYDFTLHTQAREWFGFLQTKLPPGGILVDLS